MTLWIGWGVAGLVSVAWAVTWRLLSAARDDAEEAHRKAQRLLQEARDELSETRASAARRLRTAQDDARFAGKALAEAMIPVEDAMTLAEHADGDLESVRDGVSLVKKQLRGALASAGVLPFEPEPGAPFDPHTQECLLLPGGPDAGDVVIDVVDRIGWRHHERLLRPAQVRLVRRAAPAPPSVEERGEPAAPAQAPSASGAPISPPQGETPNEPQTPADAESVRAAADEEAPGASLAEDAEVALGVAAEPVEEAAVELSEASSEGEPR